MNPPKSISRINKYLLSIEWPDGFSGVITLERLREECPCAMCKGESIMGEVVFPGMKMLKPGMNELQSLTPVGNYGIQAQWKDGHATGIYTWEALREIVRQFSLNEKERSYFNNAHDKQ